MRARGHPIPAVAAAALAAVAFGLSGAGGSGSPPPDGAAAGAPPVRGGVPPARATVSALVSAAVRAGEFPAYAGSPRTDPWGFSMYRMAHREWMMREKRAWERAGRPAPPPSAEAVMPHWTNIRVSPPCDVFSSETTIGISLNDPLRLAAGANDKSCGSPTGLNGTYASSDGGNSWFQATGMPAMGGTPYGDPSIAFHPTGDQAIYTSLWNGLAAIACFRSTNGGATWPNGSLVYSGGSEDKNWSACDPLASSPYYGRCYTAWDSFPAGESCVVSRSTNAGANWSAPVSARANTYYPTITTGVGGVVLVTGQSGSGQYVARSTDGGLTWASVNGYSYVGAAPGIAPFSAIMAGLDVDRNPASPFAGRVYMAVADARSGQGYYHIWLRYSTDNGATWNPGTPIQVDEDAADTHEHAFPWLAVSQNNGAVHVFYYDFGCPGPGSLPYRYMMASSMDGGATWRRMVVQDAAAGWTGNRAAPNWVGDYEGGVATDRLVYPYWADSHEGSGVTKSYTQPVPNPMPWVSSVSPPAVAGITTSIVIAGGALVPTITPYAILFDHPGITGAITGSSNGAVTVSVSVDASVPPGPHEWSLQYGIPVAGVTVAAAAKSGCQFPLVVTTGSPTQTVTPGGPPFSSSGTPTSTATATITSCVFGYDVIAQAASTAAGPGSTLRASGFVATLSGSFVQANLFAYISASGNGNAVVGLYTNNAGYPGTKIAQTNAFPVPYAAWHVAAFPATAITAGTTYWIVHGMQATSGTLYTMVDNPAQAVANPVAGAFSLSGWTYNPTLPAAFPAGASNLGASASHSVYLACVPATTPTASFTDTRTSIWSLTATSTRTPSGSATQSGTRTPSRSGTPTRSATASRSASATATASETSVPKGPIRVVPNPGSLAAGGITFLEAPPDTAVRIYALAGERVRTLASPESGFPVWDLRNERGGRVAPGLYYFVARYGGGTQAGRILVLP